MRINIIAALLVFALSIALASAYVELTNQDDHFLNINGKNYVLAVFYDSRRHPGLRRPISEIMGALGQAEALRSNGVLLELVDTSVLPFFDDHYDLAGKPTVRLFIRNQMLKNPELDEQLAGLGISGTGAATVAEELGRWIGGKLSSISTELANLNQLRELVLRHGVVGLYSGSHGSNFDKFFRVASKNIDFTFAHTFDPRLAEMAYTEFGRKRVVPESDTVTIIRRIDGLNQLDTEPLVNFSDFDEPALTEFIEFERYDKLRPASHSSSIFQKLFHKHQPLLLYSGKESHAPERYAAFIDAVRNLPKNMIYAHTDTESEDSGTYHRLFMLVGQALEPGRLHLIHAGADRKIVVTPFKGAFNPERIRTFVGDFMRDKAEYFRNARAYLYDKVDAVIHGKKEEQTVDTEL